MKIKIEKLINSDLAQVWYSWISPNDIISGISLVMTGVVLVPKLIYLSVANFLIGWKQMMVPWALTLRVSLS